MTNFVRILPQTARDCSTPDCVTYPAMNLTGSEGISAQYYTTICKICQFVKFSLDVTDKCTKFIVMNCIIQ